MRRTDNTLKSVKMLFVHPKYDIIAELLYCGSIIEFFSIAPLCYIFGDISYLLFFLYTFKINNNWKRDSWKSDN